MAVERTSGFRSLLVSAEELSALQPRPATSTLRGLPVRDSDVFALRDAFPTLDVERGDVLPIDPDEGGSTEEQTPVETYLAWLNRLGQLARAETPDFKAMLMVADDYGIPRHTALQDIFDSLGITSAAEEDPQLQDWMSMILRNGGDIDLDTLSNVLEMMRTIADPEHKRKATAKKSQDRVLAEVAGLKDQLTNALSKLDTMRNRQDDLFNAQQAQIDNLAQQVVAWEHYHTDLQGLSQRVQGAVGSDGLDSQEIWQIAVDMHNLRAPDEAKDYVSAAEWQAAIAGINAVRGLTDDEATIAAGQIAEQLLDRETAGIMTIDPSIRDTIVQARDDGKAAAAASTDGQATGTEAQATGTGTQASVPATPTAATSV